MNLSGTAVERTYREPSVDEGRPIYPRQGMDRDAALLAQLRRGEAGAAEALVGAYGDRVYRLALRITGNASDAEEVVQDALWAVSRKIDTFRGGGLRLLGVPDHRQRGLSEAARTAAEPAERRVMGRSRPGL